MPPSGASAGPGPVSPFFRPKQPASDLLTELDERRDATFVVVWDYARLARDMTQLEAVIGLIRSAGAEVATITGVEAAARFISAREIGRTQSPDERRPHDAE